MYDMGCSPVPSGIWLCEPLIYRTTEITNPYYPKSTPIEPEEVASGSDIDQLVSKYRNKENYFIMNGPVVMDYASELVRTVRLIKEQAYELVLCPLRGARLPGIQARVMLDNADCFRQFDGTGMAQGNNDTRILNEIESNLSATTNPEEPRRLGVLDTAIGGDSCNALARLLETLNKKQGKEWIVRFHLIHPAQRQPPRAVNAFAYQTKTFRVEIDYHPVADLLIEDEPKLLGYGTKPNGTQTVTHRLQQDGQIILLDQGSATLFRKAPLDEMMIGIVSEKISEQIQSLPDAVLIDPDRWKEHTP